MYDTEDAHYLEREAEWKTEQVELWLDTAKPLEVAKMWFNITGFNDVDAYSELADLMIAIVFGHDHKHSRDLKALCYSKMVPIMVKHYSELVGEA